jgi:hypothetical protein
MQFYHTAPQSSTPTSEGEVSAQPTEGAATFTSIVLHREAGEVSAAPRLTEGADTLTMSSTAERGEASALQTEGELSLASAQRSPLNIKQAKIPHPKSNPRDPASTTTVKHAQRPLGSRHLHAMPKSIHRKHYLSKKRIQR